MNDASDISVASRLQACKAVRNASFDTSLILCDDFRCHWDRVLALMALSLPIDSKVPERWIQRLWTLHTEATRHYHTAVHILEMLEYWDAVRSKDNCSSECRSDSARQGIPLCIHDDICIVFATYFHDAIYDPFSVTNEEDSEALWRDFATEMWQDSEEGDSKTIVNRVSRFILATKTHQPQQTSNQADHHDAALAFFLDLDMAVVGKDPNAYISYAALIRKEYHFVPETTYCTKRADILQEMLDQPCIFSSAIFAPWEIRAKSNLTHEIQMLREGSIPGQATKPTATITTAPTS